MIRFWVRSAQGQGSKVNEHGQQMQFYIVTAISQEPLGGFFYHTWPRGAP